jgi:hypothetical protein
MCVSALALSLELIAPEGKEIPRRHPEDDRRERHRHPFSFPNIDGLNFFL